MNLNENLDFVLTETGHKKLYTTYLGGFVKYNNTIPLRYESILVEIDNEKHQITIYFMDEDGKELAFTQRATLTNGLHKVNFDSVFGYIPVEVHGMG